MHWSEVLLTLVRIPCTGNLQRFPISCHASVSFNHWNESSTWISTDFQPSPTLQRLPCPPVFKAHWSSASTLTACRASSAGCSWGSLRCRELSFYSCNMILVIVWVKVHLLLLGMWVWKFLHLGPQDQRNLSRIGKLKENPSVHIISSNLSQSFPRAEMIPEGPWHTRPSRKEEVPPYMVRSLVAHPFPSFYHSDELSLALIMFVFLH